MKQRQGQPAAVERRDDIAVYVSKAKATGVALGGAAFTAFMVIAALLGPTELSGWRGSPFGRAIVYLGAGLFFLLTARTCFLVFSTAPRLVVSSEGVWINSPLVFGTGIVPWSAMRSMSDVRFRVVPFAPHQTYLMILLRDPQALRARQNTLQRALYLLSGNALIWPQAVVVNDALLSMPSAELLRRIWARYEGELARYGV